MSYHSVSTLDQASENRIEALSLRREFGQPSSRSEVIRTSITDPNTFKTMSK